MVIHQYINKTELNLIESINVWELRRAAPELLEEECCPMVV